MDMLMPLSSALRAARHSSLRLKAGAPWRQLVVEHRTLMRRGGRWLLASEGRLNRLRIYALRFTSLAEALEVSREVVSGNTGMAALPVPARDA
jgi:hypothetical protein